MAETEEIFVHPYQGAYDFVFVEKYNGVLTVEELEAMKAEWVRWVNSALPLTQDIYRKMNADQQRKHRRPRVFATCGGLMATSGGAASKRMSSIVSRYAKIAADRAQEARQAAGWTGFHNLTTPDGIKTGPNGQRFGTWTLPGAEYNSGMWDGILKPDQTFTV